MKLKTLSILNSRAIIYGFYKLFPKWKQYYTGKTSDFGKVIKEFHNQFSDAVAVERYGVELPLKIGKMLVVAYKSDKKYPNFGRYNSTGDKTAYSNNHTDGLKCKLLYMNNERRYQLKDRILWEFKPEIVFRQKVSKAFAANYNNYIVTPAKGEIHFKQLEYKLRDAMEIKVRKFLSTYNEFELN